MIPYLLYLHDTSIKYKPFTSSHPLFQLEHINHTHQASYLFEESSNTLHYLSPQGSFA